MTLCQSTHTSHSVSDFSTVLCMPYLFVAYTYTHPHAFFLSRQIMMLLLQLILWYSSSYLGQTVKIITQWQSQSRGNTPGIWCLPECGARRCHQRVARRRGGRWYWYHCYSREFHYSVWERGSHNHLKFVRRVGVGCDGVLAIRLVGVMCGSVYLHFALHLGHTSIMIHRSGGRVLDENNHLFWWSAKGTGEGYSHSILL